MGPVGSQVVGIVQLVGLAQPPRAGSGQLRNFFDRCAAVCAAVVEVQAESHCDSVEATASLAQGSKDLVALQVNGSACQLDGAAAASGSAGQL